MMSSLFFVALIAFLFERLVAEAHQKNECPTLCGNVTIEPPFGIGPNCFQNEYFEVTCNASSSNSKPILTKFNLEMLQVSTMLLMMTLNIPVTKACADHNESFIKGSEHQVSSSSSLNLIGSPFYISYSHNVFASIGCDGLATLYNESGGVIAGCTSTCNASHSEAPMSSCSGYRCCQSHIHTNPYQPQMLSLKVSVSRAGSCVSAFIISTHYLYSNATIASAIYQSVVIPVELGWDAFDDDFNFTVHWYYVILRCIAIGITAACLAIPCTCSCFWACWFYKTKQRRKEIKLRAKYFKGRLDQSSSDKEVVYKTKLFTIKALKRATDNFSSDRVIGRGGQGTVYKGMLTNGQVVAVKRSSTVFGESQWKQFLNEVVLLSQLNHRNIVKLLGCCLETKVPLLVYEFIPNGTLSQHIHDTASELLITWDMRMKIASEIAGAIAYLHSSSSTPIYHRDIKSTNILLDDKFRAKVADFGISKAVSEDQTHLTTCVQGTFGYLDPEYFRSSQFSEKSDIYSFGVILVELLTRQLPVRETASEEERSLVVYFISAMTESNIVKILDPLILEESTKEEVMLVANIAKQCLHPRGVDRPTMKEVVVELEVLMRKKSSSTTSILQQVSLEIEDVISIPATVMDNAYTTSAIYDRISTSYESSYPAEQPLFCATW